MVSTTVLTAAECKISNISDLVKKKTDYNTKFSEADNKYTDYEHSNEFITTPEFNKLTSENFGVRLEEANLAKKSDIAKFSTKTDFDNEIKYVTSTKGLIKDSINKFSVLNGAKYFSLGIFQNSLVFIPTKKCIKCFSGTTQIESWTSNKMSEEIIENITKSDRNFAQTFLDHHSLPHVNFNGYCLIKSNNYIPKKAINLIFSYTLTPKLRNLNTEFALVAYLDL